MSCQQKFKNGDKFRRVTPHKSWPCDYPAGYVGTVKEILHNGKSIYDGKVYHSAGNIELVTDDCTKFKVGDNFIRTQGAGYTVSGVLGYKSTVGRVTRDGIYDTSGHFHLYTSISKISSNLDCEIAETEKKLEELRAAKVAAERPEIKVGQVWEDQSGTYRVINILPELGESSIVFFYQSKNNTTKKVVSWRPYSIYNNLKLKDDCGC